MVYLACTPPEGRENSKYMIDHIHKVLQEPSAVIEDPFRVLVFDDFLPKDYFDKLYCDGSWEVEKFSDTINDDRVYEILMNNFNMDVNDYTGTHITIETKIDPPGINSGVHLDRYFIVVSCILYVTPNEVNDILGTRLYSTIEYGKIHQIVWKPNRVIMFSRWENDKPYGEPIRDRQPWHSSGWDVNSNSYRGVILFYLKNDTSTDLEIINNKITDQEQLRHFAYREI